MADSLAGTAGEPRPGEVDRPVGVALAAGAGTRLRPLTLERPKPLCPVGGVPMLDLALARLEAVTATTAVNVHHGRDQLEAHLGTHHPGVHISVEPDRALGTAGALGALGEWIGGRPVLVVNADTVTDAALAPLLEGWDGSTVRLLVAGDPDFGPRMTLAGALHPWWAVADLPAEPAGLYELVWAPAHAQGRLEVVGTSAPVRDCGTVAAYLAANLATVTGSGGSVVDPTAAVLGSVHESVVWDGATVAPDEHLSRAIRTTAGRTVLVR